MVKNVWSVLNGKYYPEFEKYNKEFDEYITNSNKNRCELLVKVLILINMILILIDLFVYKPMWTSTYSYKFLNYSHIIIIALFSIWLSVFKLNEKYNSLKNKNILNTILYYLAIFWCVFMALNSIAINGQISAYIVCMFCFASIFHITPMETLLAYGTSLIIFIVGLMFTCHNTKLVDSNLVNVLISITLAGIASIINYSCFAKDFLNRTLLQKSKIEIEKTNTKLKECEKRRTNFFTSISHELRTPLNVIYSANQMIEVSLKNNNPIKINKYTKMISQNCQILLRLINNLIDITKIDQSSFQINFSNTDIITNVENIVMSVVDFAESKGISLIFDTEVEERIIACDPYAIERIILNLLSNAIKFTGNKGTILVNIFIKGNDICISVKDSGVGIADDMQDMIFERFVQADNSIKVRREGSGIGLSLVKSLTEMLGGKISVKSKLGNGTEFIVSLPDKKLPENKEPLTSFDLAKIHSTAIDSHLSDICG